MDKKDVKALSDYLNKLKNMSLSELKKERLNLNKFNTKVKKVTLGQSKGPAGKVNKKKK
jgi:hypothetical protein